MLRVFKPESPMNLGAWVLSIHTGFTIADFVGHWHVLKRVSLLRPFVTSSSLKLAAIAGVPPALALGGYTGVLLGQTSTPAWSHSPVLGGLFGVSALSSGAAAVEFVEAMRSADSAPAGIRAVCAVLSGMELLGVVAYLGSSGQAARAFWRSKPGMLLACSTVSTLAGIGFDALGHRMSQPRAARALGGLATLTGGLLLRAAVVQAGKVSARDRDLQL
jgi:formate-dependent nitrite reductase membrane component NrfD